MSMFTDIDLHRAGNEQVCIDNAQQVAKFLQGFHARSLVQSWSPDLGSLGIMTRLQTFEKMGCDRREDDDIFAQSGHPVFPAVET